MTSTNQTTVFQVNQLYFMRSPCDHECAWCYKIISRTAKQVTIQQVNRDGSLSSTTRRLGIRVWSNVETCSPLGKYSMSPVLSADRRVA